MQLTKILQESLAEWILIRDSISYKELISALKEMFTLEKKLTGVVELLGSDVAVRKVNNTIYIRRNVSYRVARFFNEYTITELASALKKPSFTFSKRVIDRKAPLPIEELHKNLVTIANKSKYSVCNGISTLGISRKELMKVIDVIAEDMESDIAKRAMEWINEYSKNFDYEFKQAVNKELFTKLRKLNPDNYTAQ